MEEKCKICGKKTKQVFNIELKAIKICEDCERSIVKQSIVYTYSNPQQSN